MNVNTLTLNSSGFPSILADIPSPPQKIHWLGTPASELLNRPSVAVVGSRKATPYGRQVTENLTAQLARSGVLIVSGLALGIDSIAHRSAIESNGITMAVLGTSLDQITPASHRQLAEDIIKTGGAIVSEYPPGSLTQRSNFIARNRLVSGLADGLLITEAAAASGTMHTARFALEQGKVVMVVPGNITSQLSEGCNNLIKAGATPITSVEDIYFALKIKPEKTKSVRVFQGSQAEQKLYHLIADGISDQEEIAEALKLTSSELASALTLLEIRGYIKPLGAGQWAAI